MSKVIGITGSIASGKSTVAKKIKEAGYKVIDCDQISHNIILKGNPGYEPVVCHFGKEILDKNLEIDRNKLGEIIFDDQAKRKELNSILHPLIKIETKRQLQECNDNLVFMECPLLFETDFKELCDETLVVYVDMDNQIWRLMERDKIDFPHATKKIYTQMSLADKIELADHVIDNCHSLYDLDWQIKQLIQKLERM